MCEVGSCDLSPPSPPIQIFAFNKLSSSLKQHHGEMGTVSFPNRVEVWLSVDGKLSWQAGRQGFWDALWTETDLGDMLKLSPC